VRIRSGIRSATPLHAYEFHIYAYLQQVEFPSIYNPEMNDWKAVLAIPEPANSIASSKYFRFWAQAIAAGRLR
jgi:hypothetical protein